MSQLPLTPAFSKIEKMIMWGVLAVLTVIIVIAMSDGVEKVRREAEQKQTQQELLSSQIFDHKKKCVDTFIKDYFDDSKGRVVQYHEETYSWENESDMNRGYCRISTFKVISGEERPNSCTRDDIDVNTQKDWKFYLK
jgi:hypothetical protein